MTRYARAGKGGTHQRIAKESTSWNELKPPPPQRVRGSKDNDEGKPRPARKFKKERFTKQKFKDADRSSPQAGGSKDEQGPKTGFKKSNNSKIRGFGQSKSVQIFGQFWVPLEDAKRLKNLSMKLKEQGLPRKEILEILKNDRRKAEKASKRQRDKTCFQCRQFGHVLSDCPNLKKAMAGPASEGGEGEEESSEYASQICFKCGSTEHTSRKCKKKGDNFSFAKCFVCSGTGHIARQCPQNTKGIYPSGGSCGQCGSLNHLKKDCPDLVGVEQDSSDKIDPDAVTLRMADPFSSTEYEPVFDLDEKNEMEKDDNNSDKNDADIKPTEPEKFENSKKGGFKNKKKGNKRKMNEEMDSSVFEFRLSNTAPTKPTLPFKRKIVKF